MSGNKKENKPVPLKLCNVDLPWVKRASHLGNELCEDGSMDTDIRAKRACFIERSLQIREQFSFAHPVEILQAVKIYCCDHYGSMLWDLQGSLARQYWNSWSTCIKLAWRIPRSTHRYFLEYLSGGMPSVETELVSRYAGFYKSLLASPNWEVNIMARIAAKDIRSVTGRNLRLIEVASNGQTWVTSKSKIKEGLRTTAVHVPPTDQWRIGLLGKLLEQRDVLIYQGHEETPLCVELQETIDSLCTS